MVYVKPVACVELTVGRAVLRSRVIGRGRWRFSQPHGPHHVGSHIKTDYHFGKAKPAVLIPGPGSKCLDEIYAKYLDRTACDATHP